ncbi:MAG: T9SS type A sorting domain-containing protein [Sphingobacteriia bacterium]|nr:T9SS type A sorting domain-containing protein [Sphingobacteriia bacterium]
MKARKIYLSAIFLFVLGLSGLKAQVAVPATGSNASGSGGTVSYSIGQVVYQTHTGANESIAEGVQQPYEISVVTAIENVSSISLLITAYPNPTTEYLTLSISEINLSGLSYQLYDVTGKLLKNENVSDSKTIIAMSNFVTATYFLKVTRDNEEIKTFKIIKH